MRRWLLAATSLGLLFVMAFAVGTRSSDAAPANGPSAAPRVALPAIDLTGGTSTTLSIQNLGATDAVAVLELYAPSADQCSGVAPEPVSRVCLGALKPSQTRQVISFNVPQGIYSGYVVAKLKGGFEMIEDHAPGTVIAGTPAMAFIHDDKVKEIRRVVAEQPFPALILRKGLIDREIHFAAKDDFS